MYGGRAIEAVVAAVRSWPLLALAGAIAAPAFVVALAALLPSHEAVLRVEFAAPAEDSARPPVASEAESDAVVQQLAREVGWRGGISDLRRRLFVVQEGDETTARLVAEAPTADEARRLVVAWQKAWAAVRREIAPNTATGLRAESAPRVDSRRSAVLAAPFAVVGAVAFPLAANAFASLRHRRAHGRALRLRN